MSMSTEDGRGDEVQQLRAALAAPAHWLRQRLRPRLTGYTQEEWHAQNLWSELIHPEDRPRVMTEWREHMDAGTGTLEYRWVRRDGQVIWAITRMSVIKDEAGKPAGVRGITIDVTEQKLAEAARAEALASQEASAAGRPCSPSS